MQSKADRAGTSIHQADVNSVKLDCVKRPADVRAKLIKFFRLRLEAHALGVAIREYSEDRRFIGDMLKRLKQERECATAHVRDNVSNEMFRQIARIDADVDELAIELELISQLISEKQAQVVPLRNLLGPMRDVLRATSIDIFADSRSVDVATGPLKISTVAIYADARGAD